MYSSLQCINRIDAAVIKQNEYKNALTSIKTAKGTCKSDAQKFATTVNKITGDMLKMKKKGSFEGEMANKLSTLVPSFRSDLITSKGKAEAIAIAADVQIAKINAKIVELQNEEALWRARLTQAAACEASQQGGTN